MRRKTTLSFVILAVVVTSDAAAWQQSRMPWMFDLPKGGSNCASLDPATTSAPPVDYGTTYEGTLRPLLQNEGCETCHGSAGQFNIRTTSALGALLVDPVTLLETGRVAVVQPAQASQPMLRIKPGDPYLSSVFERLNCETPPAGWPMNNLWKMPANGSTATLELQAAMHDWIALGALMPDTGGDRLFIGSMESITRR